MAGKLNSIALGAGGGIVSGAGVLSCYFVARANANGANGGDWLSFAGVFLGVVATIVGTLLIETIREQINHRRAAADLDVALSIWVRTAEGARAALGRDVLGDMRQQVAYISAISADLSRSKRAAVFGMHNFNFHVPVMVERLEEAMTMLADNQNTFILHITADMISYAETVRTVLKSH